MSNHSNNRGIPQARQEVGVNLQPGYNGHLTSRAAGCGWAKNVPHTKREV